MDTLLLSDDSFRIISYTENGFPYVADQTGIASRESVQQLMKVCQCHLDRLSDESIKATRAVWVEQEQRQLEEEFGPPPKRGYPSGYIYLMRNCRNGLIKIGFSSNPKFREKTLQSEEPEIELIFKRKGSFFDEDALHSRFASKRVRGEWFRLSLDDIKSIQSETADPG